MSLRIRTDGRILCAAMHPAEDGDTYLHDGIHYRLSVELRAIVTEPMHSELGRGGHSKHGEWWWANAVPDDVVLALQRSFRGLRSRHIGPQPEVKPYGRLAWSFYLSAHGAEESNGPYIDISVMPIDKQLKLKEPNDE